ncbi:EmrB/QacA subfamily drug resistance transporter [Methanomicrobium sp. W14]|uniref:MFS transporter n=1 Tax=Methanomicrobium sp. W14 TaxID=2817839 RepID=UPI001AE5189B|nr:MFS transporter [Methanomicrobium sp. W14]MBP2133493.1 EmrB/QacA subfamily drug resistance transporter [Methanomicrobium sp. W14]
MVSSAGKTKNENYGLLILAISLATFMSAIDATIVNIALPTISESFNISSSSVSWVATAYLLVMAGCVLIFGKISDIIGFKKVFLAGFLVFTTGSFACGFIPDILNSFYSLIVSRGFQGIGGAMITAIAPAMVTAFIPLERKAKAMGIIMTISALGTAIGPTIGGILTQYLSWNWIFYINVPVGIVAILLGSKVIPSRLTGDKKDLKGFDSSGAALIFIGLATLLFAMSEGQTLGWTNPAIIASFAVAAISLCGFAWNELHRTEPLLELRLFKSKNFVALNLIMALLFLSFAGINYLLPFYLEYVQGYDSSTAGIILTSLSFAMMISGLLAGVLYNKIGGKILCILAAAITTLGYFMITHLHSDTTTAFVIACLVVIGLGLGFMVTPNSNLILNSVARKYQGMVSSLTGLERFAPMTIGIAIFNIVFIQGMLAVATRRGVTQEAPVNIKLDVISSGFDLAFFFAFLVAIVILVLTLVIKQEVHPDYLNENEEDKVSAEIM